jgi:hypothetical protein
MTARHQGRLRHCRHDRANDRRIYRNIARIVETNAVAESRALADNYHQQLCI